MAPTSLFGSVVRKANRSLVVSPSFTLRTDFHCGVHMPAKNDSGLSSLKANQTGGFVPSGRCSFSEKLLNGTTQRFSMPSQRRQWGDFKLRMLVTPGSLFLPWSANAGDGMPHLAEASSRAPWLLRTIGAT